MVNTSSKSQTHHKKSTIQVNQRPPTTPQTGGDKKHIAALDAQMALLVQQNEELRLCFPAQSQSKVNWNGHSKEQGNHNHHSDGRSHQGESHHHHCGSDQQNNQGENNNLEPSIQENTSRGENSRKTVEL